MKMQLTIAVKPHIKKFLIKESPFYKDGIFCMNMNDPYGAYLHAMFTTPAYGETKPLPDKMERMTVEYQARMLATNRIELSTGGMLCFSRYYTQTEIYNPAHLQ